MISPRHTADSVDADLPLTVDLHQRLHWDAIREVCRDEKLAPEQRRAKLRFLIAGLVRGQEMTLAPMVEA